MNFQNVSPRAIFNYKLFNFFNILTTICSHFQHLQWQFSHFFFDKHNNKFPHFVIILNYKWLIYLTFLPTNHFLTSWGEGEGGAQISSSPSKHFLFLFVVEVCNISVSESLYVPLIIISGVLGLGLAASTRSPDGPKNTWAPSTTSPAHLSKSSRYIDKNIYSNIINNINMYVAKQSNQSSRK